MTSLNVLFSITQSYTQEIEAVPYFGILCLDSVQDMCCTDLVKTHDAEKTAHKNKEDKNPEHENTS